MGRYSEARARVRLMARVRVGLEVRLSDLPNLILNPYEKEFYVTMVMVTVMIMVEGAVGPQLTISGS